MPTIEISDEQAQKLARGENITIKPPDKKYVVVRKNGDIMLVTGRLKPPYGPADWSMAGIAKILYKGPRSRETQVVGSTIEPVLYNSVYSHAYIEVPEG